jgi:hypothetical protein
MNGPTYADLTAEPCPCGECLQAGVTEERRRRDPHTGRLMHGYELRRWLDARDKFMQTARAAVGPRGRHQQGFERLVSREPGEDDE